jgi:chromosomal replication initiation ATPase DnaA
MDAGYMAVPGLDKQKLNRKTIFRDGPDKEIIDRAILEREKSKINIITRVVCGVMWANHKDLKRRIRKPEIVEPRQVSQFFCRQYGIKYELIATAFNQRTHANVYHSITAINNFIDTDPKRKFVINEIEQLLTKINL